MSALVFGLVSRSQTTLREMTIAWSRYGYRGPIVEGVNVNLVLNAALLQGYDFCLVQRAGHVIDETWYPPPWGRQGFHAVLEGLVHGPSFLVRGVCAIGQAGYPGLRADCLLVDLRTYKTLGRPDFGAAGELPAHPLPPALVAADGTILPGRQCVHGTPDIAGWGFVAASLANGLPVTPFPAAFDAARRDLAANGLQEAFAAMLGQPPERWENRSALDHGQQAFLAGIEPQLRNARKGVFLWNIEPYDDIESVPDATVPDALVAVAAGFKPNRILHTQGFTTRTEVHFVDYSPRALAVRQCLVEDWNGEDFPGFVRELFRRFPHPETFYQLWAGVTPQTLDWDDVEWFWRFELERWGGAEAFASHWQAYRALPHRYTVCDLLADGPGFAGLLRGYRRPRLWWSNAFFTVHSNWFHTGAQRKRLYERWVHALAEHCPSGLIYGADYNNQPVNGLTAADYARDYFAAPCDETSPKQINRIQIHF